MKKVLIIACMFVLMLFAVGAAFAGEANIIFGWQYPDPPDDMAGFKLDTSLDGVNWRARFPDDELIDIPFVVGQTDYTSTQLLIFPDGVVSTLHARMLAYDEAGNESDWSNVMTGEIDLEPPIIAVDGPINTTDSTPPLSGTVNDPTATIAVTIAGANYSAVNNGDGTWTLADNTIAALADGTYDVVASATDQSPFGNIGVDQTSDELVVNAEAPPVPGNFTFTIQAVGE